MHPNIYKWLIAFAAGMGGLCFGYEQGVIGQVLPMSDFGHTFGYFDAKGNVPPGNENQAADLQAWITTAFTIGCFFGAMGSSRVADIISRRYAILVGATLFVIGGILQATSLVLAQLIVGRAISGISIGFASMTVPLYISEVSPTQIRGAMIAVYQLMITLGIFIATAVNSGVILAYRNTQLEWKLALGIQVIPGAILGGLVMILPYSPRWLMMNKRDEEARVVLAKVIAEPELIEKEFNHIKDSVMLEEKIGQGSWAELFGKGVRNRAIIGYLIQFFQQWTGVNVILYYGPTLFKGIGFPEEQTSIGLPLANTAFFVVGTLPGMYWIDRYGRKKLLIYGALVMAISHILVCIFVGQARVNPALGWGAIIFVYTYIIGFAATWGPVAWVYQSEIFPLRVRARGTGLCTMSNWMWNAVVGNTALRFFEKNVLDYYAYLVYGVACIIMLVFVHFFVPETMNKSLEDMDEIFGKPDLPTEHNMEVALAKEVEVGEPKA
ncbi:hypothetical protein HK098_004378 [Nowakowskiella sp. JEL0407]|nr:hypothetical protein HK098_004378 [Nowakowskiella sp. JEL0407]